MERLAFSIWWAVEIAGLFHSEIHVFLMENPDKQILKTVKKLSRIISSKLEMENVPYQTRTAKKEPNFSGQVLEYAIANRADIIITMKDKNGFEPFLMVGNEEEKLIYNTSQIPVMCIDPA